MASAVTSHQGQGREAGNRPKLQYLEAIVTDEGSMPDIHSRIAQPIAALKAHDHLGRQEHKPQLKDQTVALPGHVHIFVFLWDLDINSRNREKDTDSGNEKFQTSPWHPVQRPHHQRRGAKQDSERHWTLRRTLVHCKRRKMKWYGHVTRASGLAKTVLQGTVWGKRRRRRQRKQCEDNIRDWTGLELSDAAHEGNLRNKWSRKYHSPPRRRLKLIPMTVYYKHKMSKFQKN